MRKIILDPNIQTSVKFLNDTSKLLKVNDFDIDVIFYSYLLQSGADKFELLNRDGLVVPSSSYLHEKIVLIEKHNFGEIQNEVLEIFYRILPNEFRSKEEIWKQYYSPLYSFINLFTSILIAKERGSHVVSSVTLQMSELEIILPFDVFNSIKNFIDTIEPVTSTPSAKSLIGKDDLDIFREILKSDLFVAYSKSHSDLSDPSKDIEKVKSSLQRSGKQIIEKYSKQINPTDLIFSLVKLGGSIANLVVGGIVGSLVEFIAEKIGSFDYQEDKLVLYNFSQLQSQALNTILENSGNPLLKPERLNNASNNMLDKNWRRKITRPR